MSEHKSLRGALQQMKSASRLLSKAIQDDLGGRGNGDSLEHLYYVKGALTCAIEEAEQRVAEAPAGEDDEA